MLGLVCEGNEDGEDTRSIPLSPIKIDTDSSPKSTTNKLPLPSFLSHAIDLPNHPQQTNTLLICLFNDNMTPISSFLLPLLFFEVSTGAQNVSTINEFGGLVLGMAALDGVFLGLKYYVMEHCGLSWITNLCSVAIKKILKQDKN